MTGSIIINFCIKYILFQPLSDNNTTTHIQDNCYNEQEVGMEKQGQQEEQQEMDTQEHNNEQTTVSKINFCIKYILFQPLSDNNTTTHIQDNCYNEYFCIKYILFQPLSDNNTTTHIQDNCYNEQEVGMEKQGQQEEQEMDTQEHNDEQTTVSKINII